MEFDGKVVIVTGGAHGLGAALVRQFSAEGADVVVADIDLDAAREVATDVGGTAVAMDVGQEADVRRGIEETESEHGRVDVFFSNAGIGGGGHPWTPDATWERMWRVNVLSNVYAARHVLPGMLRRGEGYLASTASTTGITTSTSDLVYAATKHAQVAVAEWLAMAYGTRGIRVSVLCPRWMWTDMTRRATAGDVPPWLQLAMSGGVTAEEAAAITLAGLHDERFLIATGEDTLEDFRRKAEDFDGWIRRLQTWHDELQPDVGPEQAP